MNKKWRGLDDIKKGKTALRNEDVLDELKNIEKDAIEGFPQFPAIHKNTNITIRSIFM